MLLLLLLMLLLRLLHRVNSFLPSASCLPKLCPLAHSLVQY
jgi:hypothetical protein